MALKKKIPTLNDELDIRLFLFITKKNLLLVIILLILAFAGTFLYLRYTHPIYQSNIIIQVNREEQANKILNMQNLYEDELQSKIVLLSSPVFLQRAFKKLPLTTSYYVEGNILSFEQFGISPYLISAIVKDANIYGIPIYIHFDQSLRGTFSYSMHGKEYVKKQARENEMVNFPEVDLKFILNPDREISMDYDALTSDSYYFVLNNPDNIVNQISSQLQISIQDASANTILIRFNDRNPMKASTILNTLASEFQKYDVENKQESANSILQFIDDQLNLLKDTLISSEEKIQQFKKDNNIDSVFIRKIPSILMKISDIEDQYNKLGLEESGLSEMEKYLSTQKEIDSYRLLAYLSIGQFPESVTSLLTPLRDLLVQKEQIQYSVTSQSGQMKSLQYQIDIQTKLLVQTIKSYRTKLKEKQDNVSELLRSYQNEVSVGSNQYNALELIRLQRIYSINEKYYNQLIETKANYSIAKAGYVSQNIILKNSDIPTVPIFPRSKHLYFFSILIAGIIGFIMILVRYLLHNEILSVEDINRYLTVPVLGVIPKYPHEVPESMMIVDSQPKSVFTESLRAIRTNLQFITNVPGPKVIAITSTVSGEGKTFIAMNLSGVLSFSEKKVILLDLDLRKPKLHQRFGVSNRHGISTILSEIDEVERCIQHYLNGHLDFITSGPIPPNPSELILGPAMEKLLDLLKTRYNYIILDTPPVGVVTDGLRCLQLADYPIYIIKANFSKKLFLENVDRLITQNQFSRLSVILNSLEPLAKSFDYTKGYGYGYGHGYGYGVGYGYGYDYSYYDEQSEAPRNRILGKLINYFRRK